MRWAALLPTPHTMMALPWSPLSTPWILFTMGQDAGTLCSRVFPVPMAHQVHVRPPLVYEAIFSLWIPGFSLVPQWTDTDFWKLPPVFSLCTPGSPTWAVRRTVTETDVSTQVIACCSWIELPANWLTSWCLSFPNWKRCIKIAHTLQQCKNLPYG